MTQNENDENWNLYVLRYDYSANYYVGTNQDLKRRMGEHWKRTSPKRLSSIWSSKNIPTKGFRFYWFKVEKEGVEQGVAEKCEYCLANELVAKIKPLNVKARVGNGLCVDGKITRLRKVKVKENKGQLNNIDNEIDEFLKNLPELNCPKLKKIYSIKCYAIGHIGEYDKKRHYNKKFEKIADFEYLAENE